MIFYEPLGYKVYHLCDRWICCSILIQLPEKITLYKRYE